MSIIDSIAAGIERQEGVGCRNNNPGALRSWGNLPTSGGFAVFPTCDDGRAALRQQVQRNINRGLTLEEFFGGKPGVYPGYAPAGDGNQPNVYAANISTWAGIPLNVPLDKYEDWEWDDPSSPPQTPDSPDNPDTQILAAAVVIAIAVAAYKLL